MKKDARKFPRAPSNLESYMVSKDGARKARVKNISPVGVFVCTDEVLPVGERVYLNVSLPNYHGPLLSMAEVVWSGSGRCGRQRGMGLRFIQLSGDDFFRVDNFVKHWREP